MKRIALALWILATLIGEITAAGTGHSGKGCRDCPQQGVLCPPQPMWLTPNIPSCRPWFAAGAIFAPYEDEPMTVIRLQPIISVPPPDRPRERPITDEVVRPKRPTLPETGPIPPSDVRPRPDLQSPTPSELPGKLHVLLLADAGASDAGKAHVAGAALFEQLLRAGVRKERLGRVEKLSEGGLDAEAISKRLAELPVTPDDTLVVFYSGPAIYEESAQRFVLTPSGSAKKLPRPELRQAALDKKARLTVLLTDPASNMAIADPPGRPAAPEPGQGALETWLIGYRGVVDMHAASVGEFAAARGEHGGCFTIAFVREFGRPAGTWIDMLESVKFTTNNLFKSYRLEVLKSDDTTAAQKATFRNQESQVPMALTPLDNIVSVRPNAKAPKQPPATEPPVGLAPVEIHVGPPPARISVRLPATAQLWVDGLATPQVGNERQIELPANPGEGDSLCELRMELNGWYGIYRITVTPGKTTMVDLQVPPEVLTESKVNTSAK